jgi:hypothetical protein
MTIDPVLKALCDRVILPALLERWRVEHAVAGTSTDTTARVALVRASARA